jgi:hypothetical protein
MKAHS